MEEGYLQLLPQQSKINKIKLCTGMKSYVTVSYEESYANTTGSMESVQ